MPISHYCEKVRWVLDHKKLEYSVKNLLPGLHARQVLKHAPKSSVPLLIHDDLAIQGSSEIISYLEEQFPQNPLIVRSKKLKQEVLQWEKLADEEIGLHIRRVFYSVLLNQPKLVSQFFTYKCSWYGPIYIKLIFPQIRKKMIATMNLTPATVEESKLHLAAAVDKIYQRLQESRFLVGDTFTRADIAAASLLAPMCRPAKYDLPFPAKYPNALEEIISPYKEKVKWVAELYSRYR